MKNLSALSLLSSLVLVSSCGGERNQGVDRKIPAQLVEEQLSEGRYRALLRPLNNRLSGFIPTGVVDIRIVGDRVEVLTFLDDDAKVAHRQAIQLGTSCPTTSDDTNADGVIDGPEATRVSGGVLIPLDGDLNSALSEKDVYPVGSGFTYNEKASLKELEVDTRVRTGQNLNLEGRVVLVLGVARETGLPETVASSESLPPSATIPVVCGVLKRVN